MLFEKIVKPNRIYQEVAEKIEDAIYHKALNPGEKLPSERKLAETFGVSQRTLREALRVVEEKGLIETSQTGNTVKMIDTDVISSNLSLLIKFKKVTWSDMLQFRLDLDSTITGRAAEVATTADVAVIEGLVSEIKKSYSDGSINWDRFLELDYLIHHKISQIAGNQLHVWLLRTITDNFRIYYGRFRINEAGFIADNIESYDSILEALRNNDAEAAGQAAVNHVKIGTKHIEDYGIEDFEGKPESEKLEVKSQ